MINRTLLRRTVALLLAVTVTAGLTGCSLREERGTLIGAGIGLLAGALIDQEAPARGAVIGAAAGAIGGYAVTSDGRSHGHYGGHSGYHSPGRGHYGYRGSHGDHDDCDD